MEPKTKLLEKVLLLGVLVFAVTLHNSCNKGLQNPVVHDTITVHDTTGHDTSGGISINLIGLKSDSGFAYKVGYHLPQMGDSNFQPTASTLRLFENGVELGPAHSVHHDIRAFGLGEFSHWETTLIFSTSDNTNPLSNGRKYTYKMK